MSQPLPLEIELVTYTRDPIGTLYYLWLQSRSHEKPASTLHYEAMMEPYPTGYTEEEQVVLDTVKQIIVEDWPILQNIHFTFAIRNMPMSLREQLIRHKVGVQLGDNVGFDLIPERGDSAFWSQTMRMVPMTNFYDEGRYIIPDSIDDRDISLRGMLGDPIAANTVYKDLIGYCQDVYRALIAAGIPMEDARQVLPVGATSSLTWTLSLQALKHILGARACWIAQYGLWGKVIAGMAKAVREVHPLFANLVSPPCYSKGKWVGCTVALVNESRVRGEEDQPPCPLWMRTKTAGEITHINSTFFSKTDLMDSSREFKMVEDFREMWGIDPLTGEYITNDTSAD